jgi:hypothetical protein
VLDLPTLKGAALIRYPPTDARALPMRTLSALAQ